MRALYKKFVEVKQVLGLAFVLLLLSACQPAGDLHIDGEPSQSGAEATSSPVAEPLVELTLGPGSFFLTDPRAGLAELSSYTATLTVAFNGTQDGAAHQWSSTYVMRHTKEPAVSLLTIENSGDIPAADPVLAAEKDGAAYEIGEAGSCRADANDPVDASVRRMEPAGLLDGLLGAEEAGQETVNGVAADHYIFDERAVGITGIAETEGEIWVAADGGYILRYLRTTTGKEGYFWEGAEGTMSWDYALTDINQPMDLTLPEDCQVEAPLMADASNVQNLPGWLSFDTASSVGETATFYQEQLPGLGWAASTTVVDETSAFLQYAQGDKSLYVIISIGEAGTRVDILLTSPKE